LDHHLQKEGQEFTLSGLETGKCWVFGECQTNGGMH